MASTTALLGARRTDMGVRAAALATLAALALLGVVGLSAQRRAVFDVSTTTVNCVQERRLGSVASASVHNPDTSASHSFPPQPTYRAAHGGMSKPA